MLIAYTIMTLLVGLFLGVIIVVGTFTILIRKDDAKKARRRAQTIEERSNDSTVTDYSKHTILDYNKQ